MDICWTEYLVEVHRTVNLTENGFVNTNRLSEAYTNKAKKSSNINPKECPSKNGSSRMLSRPRRAAPLPPIPVENPNNSKNFDTRDEMGKFALTIEGIERKNICFVFDFNFWCVCFTLNV